MIPTSFDESNYVLAKPAAMTHEECGCLSVFVGPSTEGTLFVISCWKLTAEELEEIQRTGRVWLGIVGHTMPAAWVLGTSPFHSQEETKP